MAVILEREMAMADETLGVNLEVKHLKLLVAIEEAGGVSAAARTLYVTQSALSQQLHQLEERLGVRLFHRIKRKLILTPSGESVLATARRVLLDLRNTERQLRRGASDAGRTIRITTECYSCYSWLPAVFRRLRGSFPQVEIQIDVTSSPRPIPPLLRGELDVAIVSSHPTSKDIRLERLFEDEMVVALWPGHRLEKKAFLKPGHLSGEDILIYPPRRDSYFLHRILYPAGVRPASVLELPLTEAITEMIRARMGVALLAKWAIAPHLRAGTLVGKSVTRRGFRRVWSAATATGQSRHPALSELLTLLRGINDPSGQEVLSSSPKFEE
jgi:LysR family transcriptional regulator for metE and metH